MAAAGATESTDSLAALEQLEALLYSKPGHGDPTAAHSLGPAEGLRTSHGSGTAEDPASKTAQLTAQQLCNVVLQLGGGGTIPRDIAKRLSDLEQSGSVPPKLQAAWGAYASQAAAQDRLAAVIRQQPEVSCPALESALRQLAAAAAAAAASAGVGAKQSAFLLYARKLAAALLRMQSYKADLEPIPPSPELLSLTFTLVKVAFSCSNIPSSSSSSGAVDINAALMLSSSCAAVASEMLLRFVGKLAKVLNKNDTPHSAKDSNSSSDTLQDANSREASALATAADTPCTAATEPGAAAAAALARSSKPWIVLIGRSFIAFGNALHAAASLDNGKYFQEVLQEMAAGDEHQDRFEPDLVDDLDRCQSTCAWMAAELRQPPQQQQQQQDDQPFMPAAAAERLLSQLGDVQDCLAEVVNQVHRGSRGSGSLPAMRQAAKTIYACFWHRPAHNCH